MRRWATRTRIAVGIATALVVLGASALVIAVPEDGDGRVTAPGGDVSPRPVAPSSSRDSSASTTAPPPVEVRGIVVQRDEEPTTAAPTTTSPPEPLAVASVPEPQPEPEPAPQAAPPPCPTGGGDFLSAHNSIRCANGLSTLGPDPAMSEHAQFHAQRLLDAGACANLFHSSELPSWYGAGDAYWGENAACMDWSGGCWSDAGRVMDGWMASPEHRPNILNPHFDWMGVGVACDGRHTYFVVQFRS